MGGVIQAFPKQGSVSFGDTRCCASQDVVDVACHIERGQWEMDERWSSLAVWPIRGEQHSLGIEVFPIGSRVRVTNYSPFRGLRGTIRAVDNIDVDFDEPFCFYLIDLEGVQIKEPMWFEYHEVELVAPPHVDS